MGVSLVRMAYKPLAFLSFIWLGINIAIAWFILRDHQDWWLQVLAGASFVALGLLGAMVFLLFRQMSITTEQQERWQSAQYSVQQLLDQRDQLSLLVRLMHQFVLASDRKEVARALLQELVNFFNLQRAEAVVFGSASLLHGVWGKGDDQPQLEEWETLPDEPLWKDALQHRTVIQQQNMVTLPIVTDGDTIAAVRLVRPTPNPFTPEEVRFLQAISDQAALAFERAKLISFLEELSITDALTGIANRRHLEWRLTEEVERARRYQYPLTTLMVDIDHFKQVNDTYGHQVGDKVLQQVVQRMRQSLRRTDFLARYGGEEFLILAPQTPMERALTLAERLRRTIASDPIEVSDQLLIPITVSIGVAVFPQHGQNERELINTVDAALYKAKQDGRNCVRMFETALKGGER